MAVHERLAVQRMRVIRLRGVAPVPTGPDRSARGGTPVRTLPPVDLEVAAGSFVVLEPGPAGSTLLDCIDASTAATGELELAGSTVDALGSCAHRSLLRRSVRRVDLRRTPYPQDGRTVRDLLARTARWPTLGPSLPVRPLLDAPVRALDEPTRALVAVAVALAERADVLLLDAPAGSGAGSHPANGLAEPLRAAVELEGRTVVAATDDEALRAVADQVARVGSAI